MSAMPAKPNSIAKHFNGLNRNRIIALSVAVAIVVVGIVLVVTHASGFFAASEPENGTVAGNANLVNDASASGGKAIQFNAPVTSPPGGGTPPPSTSGWPDA